VPDTVADRELVWGEVLSVGEGKTKPTGKTIPIDVKVGEVVVYERPSIRGEFKPDGDLIQAVDAELLLGVWED
jgi:co-chaperonin GroES (HSP10)